MKLICCALAIFLTANTMHAQTFPVKLCFNNYNGRYFMDEYKNKVDVANDSVFQLTAGPHVWGISGYVFSEVSFTVGVDGKVVIVTNPDAASVKQVTNGKQSIPAIVFNTTSVTIAPNGAIYCMSSHSEPYPHYQTSGHTQTFRLIKGLSYFIATQFSGNFITAPDSSHYNIPELFFYHVDKSGMVSAYNADPVAILAATYTGNTVSLNTTKVTLNPATFGTTTLRVQGYPNINTKKDVYLIKGLGVTIAYNKAGAQQYFYAIPM